MKLCSEAGDFIEIANAESDGDAYDLLLLVRVRYRGFAADIDTWVQRAAWMGFVQDLCILEERRQGEAKLESISPGELSLVVRSLDRAGHMGVEGTVGMRSYDADASLRFKTFAFDPSQLVALMNEARAISSRLP
jgi:hypothetical protein